MSLKLHQCWKTSVEIPKGPCSTEIQSADQQHQARAEIENPEEDARSTVLGSWCFVEHIREEGDDGYQHRKRHTQSGVEFFFAVELLVENLLVKANLSLSSILALVPLVILNWHQ